MALISSTEAVFGVRITFSAIQGFIVALENESLH